MLAERTWEGRALLSGLKAIVATGAPTPLDSARAAVEAWGRSPLHVVPMRGRCRKVVYTTKLDWIFRAFGENALPRDVAILSRYGLLFPESIHLVETSVRAFDAPVFFIGDLDPLDLAIFAQLYMHFIASRRKPKIRLAHGGVSGAWFRRCVSELKPTYVADERDRMRALENSACIKMESVDREALKLLKRLPIDWAATIGPDCEQLLKRSFCLELEGATQRAFYSQKFFKTLVAEVFG